MMIRLLTAAALAVGLAACQPPSNPTSIGPAATTAQTGAEQSLYAANEAFLVAAKAAIAAAPLMTPAQLTQTKQQAAALYGLLAQARADLSAGEDITGMLMTIQTDLNRLRSATPAAPKGVTP